MNGSELMGAVMDLRVGDCLDVLRTMPECSVDAVVTDPPYGIGFMGNKWDYDVPSVEIWKECLRVLKPGGHLLAFAGARTQHRMAVRIEDAGFEIRDMIAWVYGSGFPKSMDVSKAIEKAAPATDAAKQWDGWGTALKPAIEPITMARKPLCGTVAANVQAHGTGALNINASRVEWPGGVPPQIGTSEWGGPSKKLTAAPQQEGATVERSAPNELGRFPANLIHDGSEAVMDLFPDAPSGGSKHKRSPSGGLYKGFAGEGRNVMRERDAGSAARFFYCAKAAKKDKGEGNTHPTVKPAELMRYLCRLVTPPGGLVLDPFMGSGSTGKAAALEGFGFVGVEREAKFAAIAEARIFKVVRKAVPDAEPQLF